MQVFVEPDEAKVLPIPYWTDGDPGRRFYNVKQDPALVDRIEELADCPELRGFIVRVNGARSRLATLGCAHWVKTSGHPGFTHEAGLYADLVFDRFETAAQKRLALDVVDAIRARAAAEADDPGSTVIRVQPQRVAFAALGPETAWMLSAWAFGAGRSPAAAVAARGRSLAVLEAACAAASRDVSARFGQGGTPVPP